jgi:predicted nucleic acid-binding protein
MLYATHSHGLKCHEYAMRLLVLIELGRLALIVFEVFVAIIATALAIRLYATSFDVLGHVLTSPN